MNNVLFKDMERWATNAYHFAQRGGLQTIVMRVPIMQNKEYARAYYIENREKKLAYQNKYNHDNKDKVYAYQKEYLKKKDPPRPVVISKGVVVRFE
jgi:hypothetical protein